jgi:hypothetical protein
MAGRIDGALLQGTYLSPATSRTGRLAVLAPELVLGLRFWLVHHDAVSSMIPRRVGAMRRANKQEIYRSRSSDGRQEGK